MKTLLEELKPVLGIEDGVSPGGDNGVQDDDELLDTYGEDETEDKEEGEEGEVEEKIPSPSEGTEEPRDGLGEETEASIKALEAAAKFVSEEGEKARAAVRELEGKVRTLESRERDVKKQDGLDYGEEQELWVLKGKCFSKGVNQYSYEICPYENARQKEDHSSVTLGRWDRLEREGGKLKFFFTKGQKCWNGPERSLTVTVTCGVEDEVISVDEPSICEYSMDFRSPAACDIHYSEQLKLDLEDEDDGETLRDEL
jgi:protein kinase C substrate 80K-H